MRARSFLAALCCAALGAATPAAPSASPAPDVSVEASGQATVVRAAVEIGAPPWAVWRVIYDCAYAARLMEKLKSCRVLERGPDGLWDLREHVVQPLILPPVRMVMRSEYDAPRGVVFRQVEGDVRGQAGRWRLEALDGGTRTRAVYENRIVLGLPVAGPVFRHALRAETPKGLLRLRQASEALARHGAG